MKNYMTKPQQRRLDFAVKTYWELGYQDDNIADVIGVPDNFIKRSRFRQKLKGHKSKNNDKRLWPLQPIPESLWGIPVKDYIFAEESPVNVLEGVVEL